MDNQILLYVLEAVSIFSLIGVGIALDRIILGIWAAGRLLIDESDPDTDRYRISIRIPLSALPKKKWVLLRVEKDADLSQKKPRL